MSQNPNDPIAAAMTAFKDVMTHHPGIMSPGRFIHVNENDVQTLWTLSLECEACADFETARHYMEKAVAAQPSHPQLRNRAGELCFELGLYEAAAKHLEAGLAAAPDHPDLLTNLGLVHQATHHPVLAQTCFEQALAVNPDHLPARLNRDRLYSATVPAWHFAMMNDTVRNDAFEAAIGRVVTPQTIVLEIGTGSGLLAMMAARAGAKHVYTIEMEPVIAETARTIIAKNGFAERITVITKNSQDVILGQDLPTPADVLITETADACYLGENTLTCVEHARATLLKPDAAVIPARGTVMGCLLESPQLWQQAAVTTASGFDLSDFNRFQPESFVQTIKNFPHQTLSEDFQIFKFDHTGEVIQPQQRELTITAARAGVCHLIASWFRMDLDDQTHITTRFDQPTCWQQSIQLLKTPQQLNAGDTLSLIATHNRKWIQLRPLERT